VAEPGVEPGLPKRLLYGQLSDPSLASAGEGDGIRTRSGLAHNQAPQPLGSPSVAAGGTDPPCLPGVSGVLYH
jgi:hypothetical protein